MSEPTQFSYEEILNGTLLSSMAYLEDRYIRQGNLLQRKAIAKIDFQTFINENEISRENIASIEDFKKYVDKYLEKVASHVSYKAVLTQKTEFYKKFQEELNLVENPSNTQIARIAKSDAKWETRRIVANHLIKELKLFSPKFADYQNEMLKKFTASEIAVNGLKKFMRHDIEKLWEKTTPVEFSVDIQKKYKIYNPTNESNIKATFYNGYIEAGETAQKYKDASLFIGYIKERGENVLYISFRGTEQKVKSAFRYFIENYPNMERQYNYFEPILKDILNDELKKHKQINPHKKLRVVFTGHSLGAALAEKSLDKFPDTQDMSFKGIFISNPGSFHYVQSIVNKLDKIDYDLDKIKNSNIKTWKTKFINLGASAMKAAVHFLKFAVVGTVGFSSYTMGAVDIKIKKMGFKDVDRADLLADVFELSTLFTAQVLKTSFKTVFTSFRWITKKLVYPVIDKKIADSRACTINHEQDNIPNLGRALFQNYNPQCIILKDPLEATGNKSLLGKIFQIDYHGIEVYYWELKNTSLIDKLFKPKNNNVPVVDKIKKLRENLAPNKVKEISNEPKT